MNSVINYMEAIYMDTKRPNANETTDKLYHTNRWERTKQLVIAREHGICQRCGKKILSRFIIHHTELANEQNFFDDSRLQLLCLECHNYVTFHEGMRRTYTQEENPSSSNKDLINFD